MSFKINDGKNEVRPNGKPITDCTHLIDLPPLKNIFVNKEKGNEMTHPKAGIKILTVFRYRNGLSNLL